MRSPQVSLEEGECVGGQNSFPVDDFDFGLKCAQAPHTGSVTNCGGRHLAVQMASLEIADFPEFDSVEDVG